MTADGRSAGSAGAGGPRAVPRVLLVDDDGATRRFVAMALEDLEIELVCACDVPQALAVLRSHGPVQLLVTDLMMPGETGIDLLRHLAAAPALRGDALLVVLSARGDATTRDQFAGLGLWRQLHKPVSMAALQACVTEALQARASVREDAAALAPSGPDALLSSAELDAVARHFGGELALFTLFRSTCLLQFTADVAQGDGACARRDAPALRRLAHSLKSVLVTLGQGALSGVAVELEAAAAAGDWAASAPLWNALRDGLARLGGASSTPPVR